MSDQKEKKQETDKVIFPECKSERMKTILLATTSGFIEVQCELLIEEGSLPVGDIKIDDSECGEGMK